MGYTKGKKVSAYGLWNSGWGNGLNGPTTANEHGPTVDKGREYIPISKGTETIALVIRQVDDTLDEMNDRAKIISKSPEMHEALKEIIKLKSVLQYQGNIPESIYDEAMAIDNLILKVESILNDLKP